MGKEHGGIPLKTQAFVRIYRLAKFRGSDCLRQSKGLYESVESWVATSEPSQREVEIESDDEWLCHAAVNYLVSPMKVLVFLERCPTNATRIRETHIAVKSERRIPTPRARPNPLMSEVPKM